MSESPAKPGPATTRSATRSGLRAAVAILALGALYAGLARAALHGFPFSGDEYSYFLQGELFERLRLHGVAPAAARLFWVDHVIVDGVVSSKYPPGTSALLALGMRAGVPWLVTPIEGMVTLALVFATARAELGERAAWVSLVALGAAPLFLFSSASFYSLTLTTMWLAAAFAALSAWNRTGRTWPLVVVGAALGCAFLTRPFDALVFGCALLVLRSPKVIAVVAAGGLPFLGAHFAYQAAQFGSALRSGYAAYEVEFRATYGNSAASNFTLGHFLDPEQQFYHLDIVRGLVVDWALFGTALLVVLGARAIGRDHPARRLRDVAVAIVVILLTSLLPMMADPDDGPRSRYLSTTLLSVAFLAGPGWESAREALAARLGERWTRAIAAIAVALAPVQVGNYLVQRLPLQWVREGLYEAVAKQGIADGVVIVRAEHPTRYARNGPFFDRPVLYLSAPATMSVDEVAERFAGRPVYEAFEGRAWTVTRRR